MTFITLPTANNGNYGVALHMDGYSLWDHLCGTQAAWLAARGANSTAVF